MKGLIAFYAALGTMIAVAAVAYGGMAFTLWELNPEKWFDFQRAIVAAFVIIGALVGSIMIGPMCYMYLKDKNRSTKSKTN